MIEKIRSFIAVEIPEEVRQKLREVLRELRGSGAEVKWVRPEGIHVTLKFLGETNRETLEALSAVLRPLAAGFAPFEVKAQGLGCFPSLRNPRVVWVGLAEERGALSELQRGIETAAAGFGFPPEERPFKPHLTLGRVRSSKGKIPLIQVIERNAGLGLGSFRSEQVILFRSDLRPGGAVYSKIEEFQLKRI
jgi:2'-5' RNA ligase